MLIACHQFDLDAPPLRGAKGGSAISRLGVRKGVPPVEINKTVI